MYTIRGQQPDQTHETTVCEPIRGIKNSMQERYSGTISTNFGANTMNVKSKKFLLLFICLISQQLHANHETSSAEFVKSAINDMQLIHESLPGDGGTGWRLKPLIVMGAEPYAASIPPNWTGKRFPYWKAILPWFVIYETKNTPPEEDTAVEVRNINLYVFLESNKKWVSLAKEVTPHWAGHYRKDTLAPIKNIKAENQDSNLYKPTGISVVHGGLKQYKLPWSSEANTADIAGVLVTVEHRLRTIDNKQIEESKSYGYMVMAGADYYPDIGIFLKDLSASYVPGVGLGRFLLSKNQWRTSTFIVKSKKIDWETLYTTPLENH
jgi:hypothetical protein